MSMYKEVLSEIKNNKQKRLRGEMTCIPWRSLPKFSKALPGIERATYFNVTANSKVGKTQLADFLFVIEPFEFVNENPNNNIDLQIVYFSLEVSKKRKFMQFISYKIFKETKKIISVRNLNSKYADYILEDEIEKCLEENPILLKWFEEFEKIVTIYDNIRNPFGMYKKMRDFAHSRGHYEDKLGNILDTDLITKGELSEVVKISSYKPNNPNEYIIVLLDHISLLTPDKEEGVKMDLRAAMSKYSSHYCLSMRDRWGYIPVIVHQQAADSEKQQFTFKGETIVEKLKPSPDGLGDNKTIGRDCNIMLGLFSPARYNIDQYEGYDITRLQDSYRELSIIFDREGTSLTKVDHLLFNGAVNIFKELPKVTEVEELEKHYKYAENLRKSI